MARKNLLQGFKRPKGIAFEHSELNQNYGKFTVSPFESGMGVTMGNTLRRILLSSIQGYAISAIKITSYNSDGTAHTISSEFENIPNIVEDTLEVINNLKKIRLKLPEDQDLTTVLYEWKGAREVTSDDFVKPGFVEVMSAGQHVMTLMDNASLEFEIQIDLGRGYVPSEANEEAIEEIGTIPLDAIYSPVKKVKHTVEPVRVGQRSDYDKLTLEVWTDGTVTPDDAVAEAAKIAKDHFSVFINFDEGGLIADNTPDENDSLLRSILDTKIEELELSVRSYNCLKGADIKTIGELIQKTEDDLNKARNFGKKSLQEIVEKLKEWNLSLGTTDFSNLKHVIKTTSKKEVQDEA
ncbi:MAG: DNA-directed RNA polymerase subunit alpha [Treponema sp.]|jgi:DNA-directed RNA polymerase subunit alpha|nr:DNA-directed RNA polymerase subunit alpha [Treponema sp.]